MYQIGECWKEFYKELDPDRRRELYKTAVQENEDDGANAFREELMELRYTDPRDSSHKVDNFLWKIVILPGYMRPMYFSKAIGEREIKGVIRELGLENAEDWDETKRSAAYWEYRNTAARYLSTCEGPSYAKKLFGTMHSTDEEKLAKTAKDFYSMAVLVPAKYGAEKELELFIRALKDAFLAYSPDAPGLWRAMETGQNSKGFFKLF